MSAHRGRELARTQEELIARGEEAPADQQHRIVAIALAHLGNACDRHAAGGHRQHRREAVPGRARGIDDAGAGLRRIGEPAARVREDRRVGAEQPEELAEDQRRRDTRGAGERRMGEDRHARLARECREAAQAAHHRREENHSHPRFVRDRRPLSQLAEVAGQAGRVDAAMAGLAIRLVDRALHRAHALVERRGVLIREPVVVLDDVDARARERARDRRELQRHKPLRLQRRAGKGPPVHAGERANAGDPEARSAEACGDALRDAHVDELDVVVQRRIAEQHAHELPGFESCRLDRDPDRDVERGRPCRRDAPYAGDHLFQHARIIDRGQRRLHALLERDRPRPGVDRIRGRDGRGRSRRSSGRRQRLRRDAHLPLRNSSVLSQKKIV